LGNCVAYVVNKHTEEQRPQDRPLRNTGENFKRRGKSARNTDLRFPLGYVTAKPVYIATRKPKCTKLIQKKGLWGKVKCLASACL
jgi:hypothetical protein